jgi:hypothetical protein
MTVVYSVVIICRTPKSSDVHVNLWNISINGNKTTAIAKAIELTQESLGENMTIDAIHAQEITFGEIEKIYQIMRAERGDREP